MTPLVPVAVVGVGNMGGGMLTRLLGLGWSVAVHDIDPQVQSQAVALGAVPCGSAMAAAQILAPDGVLVVVVVDAAQTEAVLWGHAGAALRNPRRRRGPHQAGQQFAGSGESGRCG